MNEGHKNWWALGIFCLLVTTGLLSWAPQSLFPSTNSQTTEPHKTAAEWARPATAQTSGSQGSSVEPTQNARNEVYPTPNTTERERLVQEFRKSRTAARKNATAIAQREGWPTRQELPDDTVYELQEIRDGKVFVYKTDNVNAAISTAANKIRNVGPYNANGAGLIAGVWDGNSVRTSHQEFASRVINRDGASTGNHSTHVGGTVGASGVDSSARGMAPSVTIYSYDWNSDTAEMISEAMITESDTNKIQISNHSYGFISGWDFGSSPARWYGSWGDLESDNFGLYDTSSRDWDSIVYNAPYYLPFKSAGNDRDDPAPSSNTTFQYYFGGWQTTNYNPTIHPYSDGWDNGGYDTIPLNGIAKNIMTVGSVSDAVSGTNRSIAAASISAFSGWGPADDGRIKPDIVANGASLYSAISSSDTAYGYMSGTSMSTPNAAGSAILLLDYFSDLFPTQRMRASTIKGLILHTADDIGNAGPDYRFGWGLMNVQSAADFIKRHYDLPTANQIIEATLTTNTLTNTVQFLGATNKAIRVTLCWTDPAGTAQSSLDSTNRNLVNDLDLRVIDPSGATNFPYVLTPTNPAALATTGDNVLDNVEQVYLSTPSTGTYSVLVSIDGTLTSNAQHYSLFINGSTISPTINHVPLNNTTNTIDNYTVQADITPGVDLNTNALFVLWNTTGSTNVFSTNAMTWVTNNLYSGTIPAQSLGSVVYYYLRAGTVAGYTSVYPTNAPESLLSFKVSLPYDLGVTGNPGNFGAVEPAYGTTAFASGALVNASCPPFSPDANLLRYANNGWLGTGSAPASGSSNSFSFSIFTNSSIEWQWTPQFGLLQTSTVGSIILTTTWWDPASTAQTVVAPGSSSVGGSNYFFAGWNVDGIRQPDATNTATFSATNILMDTSHVATAVYVYENQDDDGDSMADWWELFYFGSTNADAAADADGDGYTELQEYLDRTDPRNNLQTPSTPAIGHMPIATPQTNGAPWTIVATVTDNFSVATVTLWWNRNSNGWQSVGMNTNGPPNQYINIIPTPGTNGDHFAYQITAADEGGNTATNGPHEFSVVYPVIQINPKAYTNLLLLAGSTTNVTLDMMNVGNTDLLWNATVTFNGFNDAMEKGTNGWSHNGVNDLWHLTTLRANSSNYSWYCGDDTMQEYYDDTHASLVTPSMYVGPSAKLTYNQWIAAELEMDNYAWDGGIVEISTNDGAAFAQIAPEGGYPYLIVDSVDSPFAADTPCFAGTGGWEKITFDLASYEGQTIQLRFRFGSDSFTPDEGWYIDDLQITHLAETNTWLTLSTTNGIVTSGNTSNMNIMIDTSPIPSGQDRAANLVVEHNAHLTPAQQVPVFIQVRSIPTVETIFTTQTSTNGAGLVTITNQFYDPDRELCQMEVMYSTNSGQTWDPAWIESAQSAFGNLIVSNNASFQIQNITTTNGDNSVTNTLTIVWNTTNGPSPALLCSNTLLRIRGWDGIWASDAVTGESFIVDNEPPATPTDLSSSTHTTAVWSAQNQISMMWNSAADGYGILFTNAVNPEAPTQISLINTNVTSAALPDGTNWWFAIRAIDLFGNVSASTNAGPFFIDTTLPVANAGGPYTFDQNSSLNAGLSSDAMSGIASYSWSLIHNPGGAAGLNNANSATPEFTAVANGVYTASVTVADNAGNSSEAEATITFNRSAPVLNAVRIDNDNTYTASSNVQMTLEFANGNSTQREYRISQTPGSGTWQDLSILSNETVPFTIIGDGIQTVYVTIRDKNYPNNDYTSTEGSDSIELDFSIPNAPTNLDSDQAESGVWTNAVNHTFTWTAPTNSPSGITGFSIGQDTSPDNTQDTALAETTWNDVAEGQHTFEVKAKNGAGTWGSVAHFDLWVDTNPPLADAGGPYTFNNSNVLTIGSTTDTLSGVRGYSWSLVHNPSDAVLTLTNDATPRFSATANGVYTARIEVLDFAGNISFDEADITFNRQAPSFISVSINDGEAFTSNTSVQIKINFSPGDSVQREYRISQTPGGGAWQDFTNAPNDSVPFELSGTGTQVVYVTLRDKDYPYADYTSTEFNDEIFVDQTTPDAPANLSSDRAQSGVWTNWSSHLFTWSPPTNSGSGIASYSFGQDASADETADTIDTQTVWNAVADGQHTFEVRAQNNVGAWGSASQFNLWIDTAQPSESLATLSIEQSEFGNYAVGDVLNLSWSGFTDTLSGVRGYYYSRFNNEGTAVGHFTTNTSGTLAALPLNLTNTIYVWAVDNAGNIGQAVSSSVFVLGPDDDLDNDGLSNNAEEIAGSDASNEESIFEESISRSAAGGSIRVTWLYTSNRAYTIYWTSNLMNGAATQLITNPVFSVTNNVATWTETNPVSGVRHYWVGVGAP